MGHVALIDPDGSRPALTAAVARECRLTVIGLRPGYYGPLSPDAFEFQRAESMDPAAVVDVAATLPDIDGVICWDQSAVHAANLVAHSRGLPVIWGDPFKDLRDKATMYDDWARAGVRFPKSQMVDADLVLADGPAVVKPAALQGGIGARHCASRAEAEAAIAALTQALSGDGPDGWIGKLASRAQTTSDGILYQSLVEPDVSPDGTRLEYTAEVAVIAGEPHVIAVFSKTHVRPPHFAESSFCLPPTAPPHVVAGDLEDQIARAVQACGIQNAVVHLEFCASAGQVVFFELNPRLLGDPGPQLLASVRGVDVAKLLAAVAQGAHGVARRVLRAGWPDGAYGAFVDVRVDGDRRGRIYGGLAATGRELGRLQVQSVVARGEEVLVSSLRGPARVATVSALVDRASDQQEFVRRWIDQDRVILERGDERRRQPPNVVGGIQMSSVEIGAGLPEREKRLLSDWMREGVDAPYTDSLGWLEVSRLLPGTEQARLLLATDDAGLLAALPLWVCTTPPTGYDPWEVSGAGEPTGPLTLLGSRAGFHSRPAFRSGLSQGERSRVGSALLDLAIEMTTTEELWVMQAADCVAADLGRGHTIAQEPDALLDTRGIAPGDWVELLGGHRRQIRREVADWFDQPVQFDTVPLALILDSAGPMLAAHNRRYGSRVSDEAMTQYLALQVSGFGSDAVGFTCTDETGLLAFSFGLRCGDELVMRASGERGGERRSDGLAFMMSMHLPMRYAAAGGFARVWLGPSAEQAKARRGARLQARWAIPVRTRIRGVGR